MRPRALQQAFSATRYALREPGRISKALLPSGVYLLNTALAQSLCAEKYRILLLWQSLSQLFRWLALHFFAPVRRFFWLRDAVPYERNS